MNQRRLYRALTLLYPKDFRDQYRDDLVQYHTELVNDRGAGAAWARTSLDLLVTIPRYRLGTIMNPKHSTTALNVTIGALAFAGVASVFVGIYPGVALLGIAAVIAFTERSTIAQALRTPNSSLRRRRLTIAATLTALTIAIYIGAMADLTNDENWGRKAMIYIFTDTAIAIGAVVYFAMGLLTPKSISTGVATS